VRDAAAAGGSSGGGGQELVALTLAELEEAHGALRELFP
jgi:hypothetical protein